MRRHVLDQRLELLVQGLGGLVHLYRDRHTVQLSLEMRECVDKVAHLIYLLRITHTRSKSRREGGGEDSGKSDVRRSDESFRSV
jgi:hypothetical protein